MEQQDAIVPIPENRIKFFGGAGMMLLPSPATIANLIKRIPEHKLITTDLLRKELADEFEVDCVCPVTTRKSLQSVARDSNTDVAYWRVINANGALNAQFPGGVEGHAALLRKEGFNIETSGKLRKVKQFKDSLVRFA